MASFKKFMNQGNPIVKVFHNKAGDITFRINGKYETYNIDGIWLQKPSFLAMLHKSPSEAYYTVKKLAGKNKEAPQFQGACPECGASPESYRNGIVPCPNCGHFI